MAKKSFGSVLCFFFLFFRVISVSAQVCMNTTEIVKPNSPYDKNRRLILSTLASNVTTHKGDFDGWIGNGQDRVYAMGMCAPGAEPNVCSSCINTTSESLQQSCFHQTDAYSWIGDDILCFVRYSSKPLSGLLVLEPKETHATIKNITETYQEEFDKTWDDLMLRMIAGASSSSSLSSKYNAKGKSSVAVYGNISALMQCIPGISSNDCQTCLQRSVDFCKTQFHGKMGSIILRPSCFFRWELYTFSGAFDGTGLKYPLPSPPLPSLSPSLPPSPAPSVANVTNISKNKKDSRFSGGIIAVMVIVIFVLMISIAIGVAIFKRRKQKQQQIELPTDSVQFGFKTIEAATSNFSESNKLGEGGFGEVYKGTLIDGTEIAVKRLSKTSGQGEVEFKNEVVVVAKLQHRNLVRLLGFSLQGEEKLLVYEFVPNKSLDYFLFDAEKRTQLDWTVRHSIIGGITRGLLYLHQDSRLKVIHRDLKASNILLDSDMNPKIADFGMARIVGDQTVANTSRVAGTFGYMPPEYVSHGQFSTKSDVYSFGVLILEIISGKRNSSFYQTDGLVNNLVTYVWRLWENKSLAELIDPLISEDCNCDEVTRYVHIGLLCVQENPSDRPTMSTVYQMLTTSSIALPVPLPPGFFFRHGPGSNPSAQGSERGQSSSKSFTASVDDATITDVVPR